MAVIYSIGSFTVGVVLLIRPRSFEMLCPIHSALFVEWVGNREINLTETVKMLKWLSLRPRQASSGGVDLVPSSCSIHHP
jgi:hypothetical protein